MGFGRGIDSLKGDTSFFERYVGRQRAGTSRVIKFHFFLGLCALFRGGDRHYLAG
jgi:hypothetical protein